MPLLIVKLIGKFPNRIRKRTEILICFIRYIKMASRPCIAQMDRPNMGAERIPLENGRDGVGPLRQVRETVPPIPARAHFIDPLPFQVHPYVRERRAYATRYGAGFAPLEILS